MPKKKENLSLKERLQTVWEYRKKIRFDDSTIFIALACLVMLVALGLVMYLGISYIVHKVQAPAVVTVDNRGQSDTNPACPFRRALDGVCVDTEEKRLPKLVAVTVENHIESRPQDGLAGASVVYEVPVEGNITRFLAIYPEHADLEKVGPVRSARPYCLDWLEEYGDIMYMHVGGSPDALAMIVERNMFDITEIYRGWYFWRSADRYAPHNVYTSSDLWRLAFERETHEPTHVQPMTSWQFEPRDACTDTCASSTIRVVYSAPVYAATWEYSSSTNRYARFQMGRPHADQNGEEINADTVIVQHVRAQVLDNVGRLGIDTVGEGEAAVFRAGEMIEGTWKKNSIDERTEWFDVSGQPIKLQPGKIWVEVVSQNGRVEISNSPSAWFHGSTELTEV